MVSTRAGETPDGARITYVRHGARWTLHVAGKRVGTYNRITDLMRAIARHQNTHTKEKT
ncbi:hypothetical protein LCGC14_2857210 [marine sediment metagenome]|uniref:Uncharacterized protein n=1 Tax=marine sediment metagenome TaxID=412755 RepID=A0A0F8YTH2_9ZZZZ